MDVQVINLADMDLQSLTNGRFFFFKSAKFTLLFFELVYPLDVKLDVISPV